MTGTAAGGLGASPEYSVEQSALGRVVIAPHVPAGYALFYTTRDIEGRGDPKLMQFVRERFGIEAKLRTCHQVHGIKLARVHEHHEEGDCGTCDALWTDQPHTALGIKVADCLPVTLIDPQRGMMANIHSGWRGAAQRIVDITLDAVGATPSTMAWFGPSIRVCCFEVGEEVVDVFRASCHPERSEGSGGEGGSDHSPRATQSPGSLAHARDDTWVDRTLGPKPHLDLVAFTTELLQARGITQIHDSGLCTRCGDLFHSYRREPKRGGRNLAIVAR